MDSQSFNIFHYENIVGKQNVLLYIGNFIYHCYHFNKYIDVKKFDSWTFKISQGYSRNNPYHNDLHAADVTITCYQFLKLGKFHEKIPEISHISLILSCICHDYKHPGKNNNFLRDTNDELAIRYNDKSILENMHISESFKLMRKNPETNIFENLDIELYKQIRKEMISCVLYTDMEFHNEIVCFIEALKAKKTEATTQKYLNFLIHTADISNVTKPWNIYKNWIDLVCEEFFQQGDLEKKLNMKVSTDRLKTNPINIQLGFIKFICYSYVESFSKLFPDLNYCYENLKANQTKLLEMKEEKEKNEKK
jgi:hypothetical protein